MLGGLGAWGGGRRLGRRLPLNPVAVARSASARSPPQQALALVCGGSLLVWVWLYAAQGFLGGGRGAGGVWGPPRGVVKSILVPARSLDRFDRNHMYRFRADDHSYFRALKKMQEGYVRNGVLQIEGWQSYVDSIPELRAMQKDCAAPPDVSFYDRFSRNVPNMTPRGDLSGVTGLRKGFEVNDGMVRMRGEFKTNLAAGTYPGVDRAAAAATDRWMKNSGNFYYPPAGFREWHTNQCQYNNVASYEYGSEHPVFDSTSDCRGQNFTTGWRGYLIYAPEDEKSWMSIMDKDQNFHTLMDKSGYVSLFYLPGEGENCWHTIVSETHRWSIGFRIEEEYFEKELLPALQANGADIEDMPLSLNRRMGGESPAQKGGGA